MSSIGADELRDEIALHWNWLEAERDPCVVIPERMEFVYANAAARKLVPEHWFGKHCFELLPVVDETCAFHCPKITSVTEATDVVYCEETVCSQGQDCEVLGVGLIRSAPVLPTEAARCSSCAARTWSHRSQNLKRSSSETPGGCGTVSWPAGA